MKWLNKNKTYRTDEWMETALYHPERGYYRKRENEPGASGDFYTPIHLSNIFAKMVCIEIEKKGYKKIVEFGGGDGYFANQITALKKIKDYTIVDWAKNSDIETIRPQEYFKKRKKHYSVAGFEPQTI